jgi:protein-export membrane protein SecD
MNLSARQVLTSRFMFWVVLAGVCLYVLLPIKKSLRFGIDLVGGTYITLEVKTEKAVEGELLERMQEISQQLQEAGKEIPTSKKIEANKLILSFSSPAAAQEAAQTIRGDQQDMTQKTEGSILQLQFTETREKAIKEAAVQSNIEVLRARLDKMSVAEITIAPQGEKNIIVELPDVDDPQQAKVMIGKPAILEFKLVERIGRSPEDLLYEYDGDLPGDMEIVVGRERGAEKAYYLVNKYTDLTGKLLRDARPSFGGQTGSQLVVAFQFSPEGGEKFYELTSKNLGKQLAIILDGEVITAPTINAAIRSEGVIEGRFTPEQANELALLLKSGAFVAPVTFEEERQIGPALGAESIKSGLISCLVGLGLLFIFIVYYYSASGILAFSALVYNLILILFGLAMVKATLTLPGIAGMVLTIGMAIDASILIFERIKEELASGVSVKKAVNDGFSDAMTVILDANITTFIVGVVLYYFGTGPIQGFAVTMMLGIISTLVTGLFFLRSLFNFVLDLFAVQRLKI